MRKLLTRSKGLGLRGVEEQCGITGLETAIVLIAFVVVSSVFAFAALSTGLFTSDKSKETLNAGLPEARGTLEMRGSVVAKEGTTSTSDTVDEITFQVANAAGGEAVNLTPSDTIIKYTDVDQTINLVSGDFTVTGLGNADTDKLVETGEIYEIKDHRHGRQAQSRPGYQRRLHAGTSATPGAVVHIERRTPVLLDDYNDLG